MRKDAFRFLRATYFRWASEIEALLPDLAHAPAVLAVSDAHVQNFGIWHDLEGRLVWGINDFDDAAVIPYTVDLVRLATSRLNRENLNLAMWITSKSIASCCRPWATRLARFTEQFAPMQSG